MDNDDVVVTIESRLKLMTQKMSQLVNSWNEQTRGLHLDSDGKLRGLCVTPLELVTCGLA